MAFDSV